MDEAILAIQAIVVAVLVIVVRALWRMSERLARLEGRLNGFGAAPKDGPTPQR